MSFAGHVQDMVRRTEQNRELLNNRKRKKNKPATYIKGKSSTAEELERIEQNMKKREADEKRYLLSVQILLGSIVVIVLLVVLVIIKFVMQ